ncbi:GNAT family N-acetyltransferase [Candidatus Bipolaricaulota bacterium]|nr:GNAT family N-acetyltransferase [Candidatus Bipolaricaulota bacterium]
MAVEIRGVRPEDKEAILAISAQVWDGEDYVPTVLDRWMAEGGLLVAELGGRVVGFAKTTFLAPGEVWLEGLRVDPAHRGKGVGKALARAQLEGALALAPRSIRFATGEVNHESIHIAEELGFREVARFTYMEGAVQEVPAPAGVTQVRDPEAAWRFISTSPLFREGRGLLGLGWRFPELTPALFEELTRAGAVSSLGDEEIRGVLIQVPDPYAPAAFSAIVFVDGDEEAVGELLRFAHAQAGALGQTRLSAMIPDAWLAEVLSRHGLSWFPDFRYVLVFEYPLS